MNAIHVLAVTARTPTLLNRVQEVTLETLDNLAAELARVFQVSCHVCEKPLLADFAFDSTRGQYHSTAVLQRMESLSTDPGLVLLGVTALDLYIPVLTFVFGEAQLSGRCAIVSSCRLREDFYGLPANAALVQARLVKEAIHELGHTLGLKHCLDWQCVMSSSYSIERIDLKNSELCPRCLHSSGLQTGVRVAASSPHHPF